MWFRTGLIDPEPLNNLARGGVALLQRTSQRVEEMPKSANDSSATPEPARTRETAGDYDKYRQECPRLVEKMLHAARLERPMQIGVAARAMVDVSLRHESDSVARLAIQIEAAAMRNDLIEVARLLAELGTQVEDL